MSQENSNTQRGGIGFLGLLTILFIGLKLTGFVDWSWVWVLSPLWIPAALGLGIMTLVFAVAAADEVFNSKKGSKR